MKRVLSVLMFALIGGLTGAVALAQEPEGTGQDWSGFRVTSFMEFGWRTVDVLGNEGKYHSDLNYNGGLRLLQSEFSARSLTGQGRLFDYIHVSGNALGGDPQQYVRGRVERKNAYRFEINYFKTDFDRVLNNVAVNPTTLVGQHMYSTHRRASDMRLTLLPQSWIRPFVGYTRNSWTGPSFSTIDLFRDEFLVPQPIQIQNNDYYIGADFRVKNLNFTITQGFRRFKNDTSLTSSTNPGNNTANVARLDALDQAAPARAEINYTTASLNALFWQKLGVTGRYSYSGGTTEARLNEVVTGVDFSNILLNPQTTTTVGRAHRPNYVGDVTLSYLLTDKWTVSNSFRASNYNTSGSTLSTFLQTGRRTCTPFSTPPCVNNDPHSPGATPLPDVTINEEFFRLVGERLLGNYFESRYQVNRNVSIRLGWRYQNRRVNVVHSDADLGAGEQVDVTDVEATRIYSYTGVGGISARLWQKLKVNFDYEGTRSNNGFTRTYPADLDAYRLRSSLKASETLTLYFNASKRKGTFDRATVNYKNDQRDFSAGGSWYPKGKNTGFEAGYQNWHVESNADIITFRSSRPFSGIGYYFSNGNLGYFNIVTQFGKHVDGFFSYRIIKDGGAAERRIQRVVVPNDILSQLSYHYQSPQARLRFKVRPGVHLVTGYEYYNYNEKSVLAAPQNYHAHLVFTGLRLGF